MGEVYQGQDESPEGQALPLPALEPLRSLAVAVELIPMRSRQALYLFLQDHPAEFPARYMPARFGQQQRMLYDSEIIKIRQMLLIEDGSDYYHSEAFINKRPGLGRPRTRPQSPIELVMRRAMGS